MSHKIVYRTAPDISGLTVALYGPPGTGKTTTALGGPSGRGLRNPLVLSCESGEDAFSVPVWWTPSAAELRKAVQWILSHMVEDAGGRWVPGKKFEFESILLDGASTLYGETKDAHGGRALQRNARPALEEQGRRGEAFGSEHLGALDELVPIIRALKSIRIPVVITLHHREWTWPILEPARNGGTNPDGTPKMYPVKEGGRPVMGKGTAPDLAPRFRGLFEAQMDILAYCYQDPETGERLLTAEEVYSPRRRVHAKDRYSVVAAQGPAPLSWSSIARPLWELVQSRSAPAPEAAPALPDAVSLAPEDVTVADPQ